MNLNTNALISILELNTYLGGNVLGEGSGSLAAEDRAVSGSYVQAINQASDYVENYFAYPLYSGSKRSDIFDGKGYNPTFDFYHDHTQASRIPIVGTPKLYFRHTNFAYGSWDRSISTNTWIASPDTLEWNSATGEVWLTDGRCFWEGTRNWKLEYTYGYTDIGDVPGDMKAATCMIAQYFLKVGEEGQVVSETSGDITRSYTLKIPQQAFAILDRYKS